MPNVQFQQTLVQNIHNEINAGVDARQAFMQQNIEVQATAYVLHAQQSAANEVQQAARAIQKGSANVLRRFLHNFVPLAPIPTVYIKGRGKELRNTATL